MSGESLWPPLRHELHSSDTTGTRLIVLLSPKGCREHALPLPCR